MFSTVQYISQGHTSSEQLQHIQTVLDAGCTWIQLRFKNQEEQVVLQLAEKVRLLCGQYKAVFIVNDHIAVARMVTADGVHLGLTDTDVRVARALLGSGKIIGGTANTQDQVLQRIEKGCDYIGLGPFRFTTTKAQLSPVLGLDGYQEIIDAVHQQGNNIPVYAIGGIRTDDIKALRQTGIYGVAVSGLLTNQTPDRLKEILQQLITEP